MSVFVSDCTIVIIQKSHYRISSSNTYDTNNTEYSDCVSTGAWVQEVSVWAANIYLADK